MIEALGTAIGIFFTWPMLATILVATVIGMITSIMPGIGGVTTIALLMVFTFSMEQHQAMAFLVTLMGAAGFAGSLTAILMNVPGDTQNAATILDGYPLSQQGRAGEAIGASATASALGAAFGVLVLLCVLPFIRSIVLSFGPPEMFAMGLAGIALIGVIAKGNAVRGLIAGLAGMAVAFVGVSQALGGHRFTFGMQQLYDGLPLVPLVIGLFAIPEIYFLLLGNKPISGNYGLVPGSVRAGIVSVLKRPLVLLQSSAIGTLIGIVPGVGGSVAPWVAYSIIKARSKEPESFGKGNIDGVIAPEAANDSKDGGALMPLFALGIPGSLSTALILSAFMFQGILPGRRMFDDHMSVVWVMLIALLAVNFLSSGIGLAFARYLVQITRVPATLLAPVVLGLSMVGSYTGVMSLYGPLLAIGVGAIAIAMVRADYPRPPFLVGFILLPIVEQNFHRSLQIHRGSYEFLLRPITLTVILLVLLIIFAPTIKWTIGKLLASAGSSAPKKASTIEGSAKPGNSGSSRFDGQDLPGFLVDGLVLLSGLFLLWSSFGLRDDARLFPLIVLIPMCALSSLSILTGLRKLRHGFQTETRDSGDAGFLAAPAKVGGWIVALPLLVLAVGMLPAITVYIVALRLFFEGKQVTWRRSLEGVAVAGICVTTIYLMFVQMLNVRFPGGFFP